jgi:hypothetical protein
VIGQLERRRLLAPPHPPTSFAGSQIGVDGDPTRRTDQAEIVGSIQPENSAGLTINAQ